MMKKSMAILFIAILIICSSILVVTVHLGGAQTSGTTISGIISSDATWTQASGPYTFAGPVAINTGVTLNIQPGTIIDIGQYYLQINGTLNAQGNQTNPIYINGTGYNYAIVFNPSSTSWNSQTNSGSIIENAIMNYNRGFGIDFISINQASPKIDNSTINFGTFDTAMDVNLGQPIISNCTINGNNGLGSIGIQLSYANALISHNTICATDSGIYSKYDNSTILSNLIVNSNVGLNLQGGPLLIENNSLITNSLGIQINTQTMPAVNPNLLYNNIQNNSQYNFNNQYSSNFNATYNWWGTTNQQAINQTIYDFKNNFNYGNVTFDPFLTSPNPQAPTFVNASAGANGAIFPSGIIGLSYGSSQTFNIIPGSGYHVADVSLNGTSIGAISTCIVQDINGPTTISATFAPDPSPTPTPTLSPSPSPTPSPSPSPSQQPTATPSPSPSIQTPAPTITSSPSPTPTVPELSFLAITVLLTTATVSSFMVRKRVT